MRKKHLIIGLSFLFSTFSLQATAAPWALYLIVQADGFLYGAAQELVMTFKKKLKGSSDNSVHAVIDLYRGDRLFRYRFTSTGACIEIDKAVRSLEGALKEGITLAFQGQSQCRTLVIYSGHGSGVEEQVPVRDRIPYSYMTDYCKKRTLSFADRVHGAEKASELPLKAALPDASQALITMPLFKEIIERASSSFLEGKKIDIIGFDACQMALLEHVEELANVARYVIASQEREYKNGWDYAALLDVLLKKADPHRVGRHLIYSYELQQRRQRGVPYSLSLFDVGNVERLGACFKDVAQLSKECIQSYPALRELFAEIRLKLRQRTLEETFIDLSSYGEELLEELSCRPQTPVIQKLSKALETFLFELRKTVYASVSSSEGGTLRGCSVYFPLLFDEERYKGSSPLKKIWSAFLATLNDPKL